MPIRHRFWLFLAIPASVVVALILWRHFAPPRQIVLNPGAESYRAGLAHHPIPIAASPDARQLLMMDATEPTAFQFSLLNLSTGATGRTLSTPNSYVRVRWNPDGKRISFFSVRADDSGRDLNVWNIETGALKRITVPPTHGEPYVGWSPDGKYLAYISSDPFDFVIVREPDSVLFRRALSPQASKISWAPDSRRFAVLDSAQPHAIDILSIEGQLLHKCPLPGNLSLSDLAWAPRSDRLAVCLQGSSPGWDWDYRVAELEIPSNHLEMLATLHDPVQELMWSPDERRIFFKTDLPEANPLYYFDRDSLTLRRINSVPGVIGNISVTADSKALLVSRSTERPHAYIRISVEKDQATLLYRPRSRMLPEIPGRLVWTSSFDGVRIPIVEFRSPTPRVPPAAVVFCHAGGTHDVPTWTPGDQLLLKNGIHSLCVNYRGSPGFGKEFQAAGDTRSRALDLLAAVQYAHVVLRVPYERIAIMGPSEGATYVAAAARLMPERIGLAVLVAFRNVDEGFLAASAPKSPRRVLLVYPEFERVTLQRVIALVEEVFGSSGVSRNVLRILRLPDEHQLSSLKSWPAIYSVLLDQINEW